MAEVGIFVGTMYGNSLLVAEEAEAILVNQGHKATVYEDPELADWEKYKDKYILVVNPPPGRAIYRTASSRFSRALKTSVVISQMFTMASLPSAIALTPISAAAVSSSTRCCRNRALSASERCC